ncbi:MAG: type II toxin-antitoxin system RelE/ParE family toxin [Clostridia bacterium]|nr:type II toxin-antitoxin system RelE/ParE family toxin [Clostridia bacterium]
MYEVEFYYDKHGKSEIVDYLDSLKVKSKTSKTDRINREKILAYIGALQKYGTRIGKPYVKHINDEIWELRPLNNRIFFFYWKNNRFVLLHHFIKKTQKTPVKEIIKAQNNLKDFLERNDNI